jgi:hypothetical protein
MFAKWQAFKASNGYDHEESTASPYLDHMAIILLPSLILLCDGTGPKEGQVLM